MTSKGRRIRRPATDACARTSCRPGYRPGTSYSSDETGRPAEITISEMNGPAGWAIVDSRTLTPTNSVRYILAP